MRERPYVTEKGNNQTQVKEIYSKVGNLAIIRQVKYNANEVSHFVFGTEETSLYG